MDLAADLKLLKNKAEIRRNIENGGAYVNNERILADDANDLSVFFAKHLLADKYLVVRFGKKSYFLVEVLNWRKAIFILDFLLQTLSFFPLEIFDFQIM